MKLSGGEIIKLNSPKCSYEIGQRRGKPQLTLTVKSEAMLMSGRCEDAVQQTRMQDEVNEELAGILTETLGGVRDEKGVDLSESYLKLGGADRELYRLYADDKTHYDTALDYEVKTNITLVDTK